MAAAVDSLQTLTRICVKCMCKCMCIKHPTLLSKFNVPNNMDSSDLTSDWCQTKHEQDDSQKNPFVVWFFSQADIIQVLWNPSAMLPSIWQFLSPTPTACNISNCHAGSGKYLVYYFACSFNSETSSNKQTFSHNSTNFTAFNFQWYNRYSSICDKLWRNPIYLQVNVNK
jgi:hypothetical protein